jgi:lipid-binding SYLF domain-containing protein
MMASSGGSIGLQAGGQAVDYVILILNDKGARKVMNGKAKLGADASIAAGPVGRNAEASTNAAMNAEMLSYSRSSGAFAGVSLSGTSLRPDDGANEDVYGKKIQRGANMVWDSAGACRCQGIASDFECHVSQESFSRQVTNDQLTKVRSLGQAGRLLN